MNTYNVSGQTYEYKTLLRDLGGKWNHQTKSWDGVQIVSMAEKWMFDDGLRWSRTPGSKPFYTLRVKPSHLTWLQSLFKRFKVWRNRKEIAASKKLGELVLQLATTNVCDDINLCNRVGHMSQINIKREVETLVELLVKHNKEVQLSPDSEATFTKYPNDEKLIALRKNFKNNLDEFFFTYWKAYALAACGDDDEQYERIMEIMKI